MDKDLQKIIDELLKENYRLKEENKHLLKRLQTSEAERFSMYTHYVVKC